MRLLVGQHPVGLVAGDRQQQLLAAVGKIVEELALPVPVLTRMSSRVAVTPFSRISADAPGMIRSRVAAPFGVSFAAMPAPHFLDLLVHFIAGTVEQCRDGPLSLRRTHMTARLQGRTALVTGSTDGIGAGIARALADEGAFVVVSGRNAAKGEKVVAEIGEHGGSATFVRADLAGGSAAARELADAAQAAADGPLDILIKMRRCSSPPGRPPRSARS